MKAARSILVLVSYHHNNTEKIANAIAVVLGAQIRAPQQIDPKELRGFDLVGFGSGIDSGKHYQVLLDLADKLPKVADGKAFIFSTNSAKAAMWRVVGCEDNLGSHIEMMVKNHSELREKLQGRGYMIVGEFSCAGFNTNSFLKFLGGMNKGRPNAEDLKKAEEFAQKLKRTLK
jgi:flavodoxin